MEHAQEQACIHAQSWLTLPNPMDSSPPGSSVHGILQEENWSGLPFPSPGHLSNPRIKPMCSALAGGFFSAEPPAKPKASAEKKREGSLCTNSKELAQTAPWKLHGKGSFQSEGHRARTGYAALLSSRQITARG